jgi:hypothetical protein
MYNQFGKKSLDSLTILAKTYFYTIFLGLKNEKKYADISMIRYFLYVN